MKIRKHIGILLALAAALSFTGCAEMMLAAAQGMSDGIDQTFGVGGDGGNVMVTDDFADAGDDDFVVVDHGGPDVDIRYWDGQEFGYARGPRGNLPKLRADLRKVRLKSYISYRTFKRMHPDIARTREYARYALTRTGRVGGVGGGGGGQRAAVARGKKKEKQ